MGWASRVIRAHFFANTRAAGIREKEGRNLKATTGWVVGTLQVPSPLSLRSSEKSGKKRQRLDLECKAMSERSRCALPATNQAARLVLTPSLRHRIRFSLSSGSVGELVSRDVTLSTAPAVARSRSSSSNLWDKGGCEFVRDRTGSVCGDAVRAQRKGDQCHRIREVRMNKDGAARTRLLLRSQTRTQELSHWEHVPW